MHWDEGAPVGLKVALIYGSDDGWHVRSLGKSEHR